MGMRWAVHTEYGDRVHCERLVVHSVDFDDSHVVSVDTGGCEISIQYRRKAQMSSHLNVKLGSHEIETNRNLGKNQETACDSGRMLTCSVFHRRR